MSSISPSSPSRTWFRRTADGISGSTGGGGLGSFVPLVTHGGPEADTNNKDANWLLGIDDSTDVIAADFEDSVTPSGTNNNHPLTGTTPITNDVWHHAAATYGSGTWTLYLDGEVEASVPVSEPPRSDTIQHAALGAMLASNGSPANTARFAGDLDEVRVWNYARSQTEIVDAMATEIASDAGLVARWGLEEGTGTTAGDSTAPASTAH